MATDSKTLIWIGRVLSALPVLALGGSAMMKLTRAPGVEDMFVQHFGWPASSLFPLGIVELGCAILYAIPRTSVLGAILVTGYLGGAVATHARLGEAFLIPLGLGILAWAGLYLRDSRLPALLPMTRK